MFKFFLFIIFILCTLPLTLGSPMLSAITRKFSKVHVDSMPFSSLSDDLVDRIGLSVLQVKRHHALTLYYSSIKVMETLNSTGWSPYSWVELVADYAFKTKNDQLLAYSINKANTKSNSILLQLSETNMILSVYSLLENGANVNHSDRIGRTSLMAASRNGNLNMVKLLVRSGANLNATTFTGATAFSEAVENGHHLVVGYLLHRNCARNYPQYSYNPLFSAVIDEDYDMVLVLLKYGFDPNTIEHDQTSLMIAATSGDYWLVKVLLDFNADASIQDSKGNTALDYAQQEYRSLKKSHRRIDYNFDDIEYHLKKPQELVDYERIIDIFYDQRDHHSQ